MPTSRHRYLYIFLDEAGNFDFTKNGTRYLQVGAITKERPFHACKALNELKYDLVEKAVKQTLSRTLPKHSRYRIFHHDSKSNFDLQIADYFNWASFRYLRDDDDRAYKVICRAVKARLEVETRADSEDM